MKDTVLPVSWYWILIFTELNQIIIRSFFMGGGAVKGELLRHRDFCRCVERTDSSLLSPD